MGDIAKLLKVMQEEMQLQWEQMRQQEERHKQHGDRYKQQEDQEQQRTPQAATCPDVTADGRHPEGRRDYGTTAANAPISSFRLHCRAMEGLPAKLRDVCQRQLCT